MWGTFVLDAYRDTERREMAAALEDLFGPGSGTTWATAGIYVYWDVSTRSVLYVGLAGDLPVRFGQHNRLRGCPARSCKKEQVDAHFRDNELLGLSVIPLSSLSQPLTARWEKYAGLDDREAIEAQEALTAEAFNEIRALEGRLIGSYNDQVGRLPPWNKDPGRRPEERYHEDATLKTIVGAFDCLLQSRKTIRQLAQPSAAAIYEEHLHGARTLAIAAAIDKGHFHNGLIRNLLLTTFAFDPTAEILADGYLDQRNPLTTGPVLDWSG